MMHNCEHCGANDAQLVATCYGMEWLCEECIYLVKL